MTLPYDMARCHDDNCPMHRACARWQDRDGGAYHAATLRDGSQLCRRLIYRTAFEPPREP